MENAAITHLKRIEDKMTRLETRITRGFEELGIDTYAHSDWLFVDNATRTIHVTTGGRSLLVIAKTAKNKGAELDDHDYHLCLEGDVIGTLAAGAL